MAIQTETYNANIRLTRDEVGFYNLTWNDGVVNEWHEIYLTQSVAVLRLAVLLHCAENNWEVGFTDSADTFARYAEVFLNRMTE